MRALQGKARAGAFTLVELLVALTIMAIVLGLLMNSLRFSMKTVESVESGISIVESIHQSQRALRRQLQLAVPVLIIDSEGRQQVEFAAQAKRLDFLAPVPGLSIGGGLYRISLRIDDDSNSRERDGRLIMSYQVNRDTFQGVRDDVRINEVVLMENFARARFSFLDTLELTQRQWTDQWQNSERLPDLVRLSVDFGEPAGNETLDMIVAIKVTEPVVGGES